jgi:hypothetical protein
MILNRLLLTIPVITAFSACAYGAQEQLRLSQSEIEQILKGERITSQWHIEQQPQGQDELTLFVTRNLRRASFGGCLARLTVIDLLNVHGKWQTYEKDERDQMSVTPCEAASPEKFVDVYGGMTEEELDRSMQTIKNLVAGKVRPDRVFYDDDELRRVKVTLDAITSISARKDRTVEVQVASDELTPRLLGIRLQFAHGALERIDIDANGSLEPVMPN